MFDPLSLEYNTEFPNLFTFAITMVSAMVLGILLAFTYERTSREISRPIHFLQAMILITIVSATVIQAIGDSVARGLGMIGTLSIIRFRSSIKDTRNLVFMFGAIAIGVACGVFGFLIAIVGTVAFCITAFLLHFSSFSQRAMVGKIKVEYLDTQWKGKEVERAIKKLCSRIRLTKKQAVTGKEALKFQGTYELKLKRGIELSQLLEHIHRQPGIKVLKLEQESDNYNNI